MKPLRDSNREVFELGWRKAAGSVKRKPLKSVINDKTHRHYREANERIEGCKKVLASDSYTGSEVWFQIELF